MTPTQLPAALRGKYPPGPAQHVLLKAANVIERLSKICQEYENDGYGNPGRAMTAVLDALGRRG